MSLENSNIHSKDKDGHEDGNRSLKMVAVANVSEHRKTRGYSCTELVGRVLWGIVTPLFRYSPRLIYGWRNFLLRCLGAKIGKDVRIYPSVRIFVPWNLQVDDEVTIGNRVDIYNVGHIHIKSKSMISQNAHLCAGSHDHQSAALELVRAPITIEENVWVCADAFIGPHVTVHRDAIVGARSAVFRNVEESTIVGGNPAKFIKLRCDEDQNARQIA
jgi:putative colanic acid biosynthesis acetyltransferase WcaF